MDPSLLNEGAIGRGDCRRTPLPGSSTGCSRSRGIRAQDRVESLLRIAWTECSRSSGIGAQDPVDYAFVIVAGGLPGFGRDRRARLDDQLLGGLIQAHERTIATDWRTRVDE